MHSTYVRNFANTAMMIIVSFLIIGVAFSVISRNVFLKDTHEQVNSSSREITAMATAYARQGEISAPELGMTMTAVASSTGQQMFITNPEGYVIACSDSDANCSHIGTQLAKPLLSGLPRTGAEAYFDTMGDFYPDVHYTVVSAITDTDGTLLGHVFVSRDTRDALSVWETMLPLLFVISLVVLVLALVFGLASSRALTQPLQEMAEAARRFGRGDLSARVDIQQDDEIGELAEAFNTMADSLEKSETLRRDFIANVSHELKTPMTTIAGFADGILDGTIPPEREKRYLETISSETKRLSRMVRSMLELSRLQADTSDDLLRESFDISEVLRRTLVNFADKIDKKGMVVLGNADAITQVVYNLFDNAIKFAKDGTQLGIALWKDSAKAYVSVKNHGSTIPESEIPLLFNRFHKSDRSRSQDRDGVGLGLYIVKTILNNHGEDIAVTSRQGVTEFVFTLALKQESRKQEKSRKQSGEKQNG